MISLQHLLHVLQNDIREVRKILKENGGEEIQIIAKIENQQGVDNIDEILKQQMAS